jgi:hypothetical protein
MRETADRPRFRRAGPRRVDISCVHRPRRRRKGHDRRSSLRRYRAAAPRGHRTPRAGRVNQPLPRSARHHVQPGTTFSPGPRSARHHVRPGTTFSPAPRDMTGRTGTPIVPGQSSAGVGRTKDTLLAHSSQCRRYERHCNGLPGEPRRSGLRCRCLWSRRTRPLDRQRPRETDLEGAPESSHPGLPLATLAGVPGNQRRVWIGAEAREEVCRAVFCHRSAGPPGPCGLCGRRLLSPVT